MENIVALKELRENMEKYANRVARGASFIVLKKSKPIFKISPVDEDNWEEVVDFTKIKKGGVNIKDILSRL
jgi:antitoxin (DNA-binding transcriptional repressor) of toxin-antitoxin stability system